MTSFADLHREYEVETIGGQIWDLLVEITKSVARRYPPDVYNRGEKWEGSYEDLAQDVAVDLLLAENQIHYIFDIAREVEDVRRLLVRQVKRALYRRRTTTVVDRLLVRTRRIASDPPFTIQEVGSQRWITLADDPRPFHDLSAAELRAGGRSRPRCASASGQPAGRAGVDGLHLAGSEGTA